MAFLPAALFALLFAAWPVPALGGPARLRVEVDDSSVRAGGSTRVVLVLLDSRFQRVSNDRSRRVQLELRSTKGAREGIGDISPAQISLPSGTDNYARIRFRAKAAGTVIIRAMSDGLASAEGTGACRRRKQVAAQPPCSDGSCAAITALRDSSPERTDSAEWVIDGAVSDFCRGLDRTSQVVSHRHRTSRAHSLRRSGVGRRRDRQDR